MSRAFTVAAACIAGATLLLGGCDKEPARELNSPPPGGSAKQSQPRVPGEVPAPPTPPPVQMGGSDGSRPTDVQPTTQSASTSATLPPSITTPPSSSQSVSKVATFAGLSAPKPATWISGQPTGQFSVAEYTVPGLEGADQAKITVFTAGGTLDANIARWRTQFRDTDGTIGGVDPTVESFEVNGMPVSIVEFEGDYKGMQMANFAQNQLFIMAVVDTLPQKLFIRFVGPRKTVEPNREAFLEMVRGLKPAEAEK